MDTSFVAINGTLLPTFAERPVLASKPSIIRKDIWTVAATLHAGWVVINNA